MKRLKKLIAPLLILLVIAAGILLIMLYQEPEAEEEVIKLHSYDKDTKNYVLENEKLKFELDAATTQFCVTVKETGERWYSNPPEADRDPLAMTLEKGKLQSTLLVTYSTTGGIDAMYNNYDYSIARGIYDIEAGEDYVKVLYSVGNTKKEYIIPPVIREEEFKELVGKMEKSDALLVQDYYKKYDINKLGKRDDKEALLANYPILAEEVIYVLRDTTKDYLKAKFQVFFEEIGYTMEQYKAHCELDKSIVVQEVPVFNINVIYRLEDGDLTVEIPLQEMEYKEKYPLYSLTVLPFFGAGSTKEEGFLFVPEGGGALIDFNNGKTSQNGYYANVYGWDMAQNRPALIHETETAFGVYGVGKENASFLCLLEDGAAYAAIQADISGKNNSYNFVNSTYNIVHREQYDILDETQGNTFVYEKELPEESLIQRYRFLASDSYVDMAKAYQEYLFGKYEGYFVKKEHTQAPAVIELIGAVDKVQQVVGIPLLKPLKLTNFTEAKEIMEDLRNAGIQNMSVKLTGWMNGGVRQKMLNKIRTVSELGSKKSLEALVSYAKQEQISFYFGGTTNYAKNSGMLDGFFSFSDAARKVSKERAQIYDYLSVTYTEDVTEEPYYLLNTKNIGSAMEVLNGYAAKRGAGVALEDVGDMLSSDFVREAPVSRQKALLLQTDKLMQMEQAGTGLMINKGNDYAVPYSDMITNMNLDGYAYTIIDRTVPFYQIALHGYVDYTGEALNLTQNAEQELLKSAECGAGLMFTLMKESAFALQKTKYSRFFGADYSAYRDTLLETYKRYNEELGHVFSQKMEHHNYVTDTMTCTVYEDGTRVYVNYDFEDAVTENGTTVPARDYKVVR